MNRHVNAAEALRPCTSCQMCAAVCPKKAITIHLDNEGFYRPVVNEEWCVDCGLCQTVCYKFDTDIRMTKDICTTSLYAATVRDDRLLETVTSGGIADLLAKELTAQGYVCAGVRYDDTAARAEHIVATCAEETDVFRGSKYIQSYTFPAFRQIVEACTKGRRIAVFGTPCQIYAVHRWLERRKLRDRAVLIDLYCHGVPSIHAWKKYQQQIKQQTGKCHFDRVDFRSKVRGWGNFYVVVVVDGAKVFVSTPRKDEFYELFFSDQVLNEACHGCRLRSTLEYADIRLGDFLGKLYLSDLRGTSAVSIVTPAGEQLFRAISGKMQATQKTYADFLPYQSYGREYCPDMVLRRKLLDTLKDSALPLRNTMRILHRHQNLKQRIKRQAKAIAYYLPPQMVKKLKRLL